MCHVISVVIYMKTFLVRTTCGQECVLNKQTLQLGGSLCCLPELRVALLRYAQKSSGVPTEDLFPRDFIFLGM